MEQKWSDIEPDEVVDKDETLLVSTGER